MATGRASEGDRSMNAHELRSPPRPDQFPPELVESLSDLLAAMLVAEWKAQHSQMIKEPTVSSPRGINHDDSNGIRSQSLTPIM